MAIKKYYVTVDEEGNTRWFKDARCTIRHREDGPAIEYANGTKRWYQNGELHRENGPAIEYTDGHKEWCQNGQRHRIDGPAIEYKTGGKDLVAEWPETPHRRPCRRMGRRHQRVVYQWRRID